MRDRERQIIGVALPQPGAAVNSFAILSPYVIPPSMPGKKVNLGDGFILLAIERLLGSFAAERVLTSRQAPDAAQFSMLEDAGTVILGGANQLNDHFTVWPGLSPDQIRTSRLRFVPFGIGLDGGVNRNVSLSAQTREILVALHERIEFSSWRCPRTIALLESALPELQGRFLMSGCPVVYDRPLLDGARFEDRSGTVAVTVTERGEFWEREAPTLEFVAKRFGTSRRFLVLHQVFEQPGTLEDWIGGVPVVRRLLSRRAQLRALARRLGFEIVMPPSAAACIDFYRGIDLHIGSRLHAHLLFLSRNKRSFLTYVDDRMLGFSQFLGFPLSDPLNLEKDMHFDFEPVRSAAQTHFLTMEHFVRSIAARP